MDINKAFSSITEKVGEALSQQGFARQKVSPTENEMVALFTSENSAYSVVFLTDKQHMILRHCAMTDEGPDNNWKTLATWMFDPETYTQKDADSIANDFADNVSSASAVKRMKVTKKKRKKGEDEGNADPLFLAKRFATLFPDMKEEVKTEEDTYYPFRGVTFTRASIVPRVNNCLKTGTKQEVDKLVKLLNTQYSNGDADTRSIVTIVILNSTPEEYSEKINDLLSPELKTAWANALKFKGKKVKPEKPKKKKTTMVERLQAKQDNMNR